jgi:RNA polymerase sigma-70 factor (ECF subfamily)
MAQQAAGLDPGELFRKHGPLVYRRAFRLLGRREDAEEATQEVFVRVLRSQDRFEGRSSITTWLYQITTHYCLNQLRDSGRRRQLFAENMVMAEPGATPEETDLLHLRRLLATAEKRESQAAVYVYLDGLSHEEAAELLGVSKRTVGNLVDRFLAWAEKQGQPAATAKP